MERVEEKAEERVKEKGREVRKGAILTLVSVSHAMNHVQSGVLHVFYPLFREEFGIGYLAIGFLSTINQLVSSVLQVIYGFLARLTRRGVLLGVGNIIVGLESLTLALAGMLFSVRLCVIHRQR